MIRKISSLFLAMVMVVSMTTAAFGEEISGEAAKVQGDVTLVQEPAATNDIMVTSTGEDVEVVREEGNMEEISDPKIKLNSEYLDFESGLEIVDWEIYAPYNELFDFFEIEGFYSYSTKKVTATKDGVTMVLSAFDDTITIEKDGAKKVYPYENAAMVKGGSVYVPAHEVLSAFGITCGYNAGHDVLVIMDLSKIDEQFENDPSLSNYRKLLEMSNSFEKGSMDIVYDIAGSFTDVEDAQYDFSGKMKATTLVNYPRLSADISFEDIAFSPQTEDSAMAVGMLSSMKYSMVMDENSMYVKMPLLGDQWIEQPISEQNPSMDMSMLTKNNAVTKPSEMLNAIFASGYVMEENTYENIEMGYNIFKKFFENDRVKIDQKGKTTTASFALDKNDISDFVMDMITQFAPEDESDESMAEFEKFMNTSEFSMAFNYIFNDKELESYDMLIKLDMQMPEEEGSLKLDANITADVENKDVTIEIPEVTPFEFPMPEEGIDTGIENDTDMGLEGSLEPEIEIEIDSEEIQIDEIQEDVEIGDSL